MGTLSGFEIKRRGRDYLLHFNIDDGQTIEALVTYDQLDLMAEEIDRELDRDEEDALRTEDGP